MFLPVFSSDIISIVLKAARRPPFCHKMAQQIRAPAVQTWWAELNPWAPYEGIKRELTQWHCLLTYTDTETHNNNNGDRDHGRLNILVFFGKRIKAKSYNEPD